MAACAVWMVGGSFPHLRSGVNKRRPHDAPLGPARYLGEAALGAIFFIFFDFSRLLPTIATFTTCSSRFVLEGAYARSRSWGPVAHAR